MPALFPFADYWWFYALFTLGVLALLALDLDVFHREAHEVKYKEALTWSIVWVSLALLFALGIICSILAASMLVSLLARPNPSAERSV